ncbi:MAG: toll/interleukin-1 receptor domain-containing protein [Acidobacteriaceae bacterium]|nr:toll/interleukin-1 receptor domain-containing protein [Acidobacteriaceae bacterium]
MGFLPDFDEDVFISYARNDDDAYPQENKGWVARLDEDIGRRVAVYLDGKKPLVWRDPDIRPNEDFDTKISRRLARTATLLSILSPSFLERPWCLRELEEFAAHAARTLGIHIDEEKSRIFKVEKVPVQRSQFPEPLRGTGTYRFYGPDPENPRKVHEFRPLINPDDARAYFKRVDDLAQDIAEVLKSMARKVSASPAAAAAPPLAVYLAETTADIDEEASQIRRELDARGYTVLPPGDLPSRAKDFREKVRDCLNNCVLSVHLIGRDYGFIPEGETEKSNEWLQSDLAIERSQTERVQLERSQTERVQLERSQAADFKRLIWMPIGLDPSDPRQKRFVQYLREDEAAHAGADVLETNLDDLKTALNDNLQAIRDRKQKKASPPPAAPAADDLTRIYILCDPLDLVSADLRALRRYLFSQGFECKLPAADDDEHEAPRRHSENLQDCDAFLIYYGLGSSKWFEAMLRDFWRFLSRRPKPVLAKAVYLAAPLSPAKEDIETLEAIVLRGADPFSPEALSPFLNKLRAPARGNNA